MFRDLKNIEVPRVVITQRHGQITITYLTVWVILREQWHQITDTVFPVDVAFYSSTFLPAWRPKTYEHNDSW